MRREAVANESTPLDDLVLASRWRRVGAAVYDALILMLVILPVAMLFGRLDRMMSGHATSQDLILAYVVSWAAFLGLNGYLLVKRGQTIGKLVLNTRIVGANGTDVLPLWNVLVLRYWIPGLALLVPVVGTWFGLLDVALIFRHDRRCIHDLLAGSRVVMVDARSSN